MATKKKVSGKDVIKTLNETYESLKSQNNGKQVSNAQLTTAVTKKTASNPDMQAV